MKLKLFPVFVIAFVGLGDLSAGPAQAAFSEIDSVHACFLSQVSGIGAPLSASGHCPGPGATASALSDLGGGSLGAFAASSGSRSADAYAEFGTIVTFAPNQTVPVTVSMELKGSIIGDPASGPQNNSILFQAAVMGQNDFGIEGVDTKNGFLITANGQTGVDSFQDEIVSAVGSAARNNIDLTLTETFTFHTSPTVTEAIVGGWVEAQVVPAFPGASTTVDFLDPATVTFSVPAGTKYTSEGFLDASQTAVPETSTWSAMILGFAALSLVGYRRQRGLRSWQGV
jgi:hypothetical protein